jgi:SpoVK/Ycf46/Vps4 family AAA+-type ATPase
MDGLVRELVGSVQDGGARCVLIVGPAACGKSLAALRVARECGLPHALLDCSLLAAHTDVRTADAALLRALLPLGRSRGRGVLVLDSLDEILPRAAGSRGARGRQVAAAVHDRLNDMASRDHVVMIATAPSLESLSEEAARLFGVCVRRVRPPSAAERAGMVRRVLGRDAPAVVELLRGCSGGDVRRAVLAAMQESDEPTDEELAAAVAALRPAALVSEVRSKYCRDIV